LALGAVARAVGAGEVELLEAALEVLPRLLARLRLDAVGAEADEEVAGEPADAELRGHHFRGELLGVGHGGIVWARCVGR
jgi:hypothetical protein